MVLRKDFLKDVQRKGPQEEEQQQTGSKLSSGETRGSSVTRRVTCTDKPRPLVDKLRIAGTQPTTDGFCQKSFPNSGAAAADVEAWKQTPAPVDGAGSTCDLLCCLYVHRGESPHSSLGSRD